MSFPLKLKTPWDIHLTESKHLMKCNDELKGLFPPPPLSLLAKSYSSPQTRCRQRLLGTFLLLSSQPPKAPSIPGLTGP